MDIFEALFTRRSIRKYTADPISDDELKTMLKAAMLAPSACNEQPWHFVCVRGEATRQALSTASPYAGPAAKASVVIAVCGDLDAEKAKGYWVQDCSAAIENLMLAARGLNIGCVWCGIHPDQEREEHVAGILNLPAHVKTLGLVCAGHADQKFFEADRFREDRVHMEKW